MQVHRDLDHLPEFRNAVITIGTFDGVHAGHRFILQQLEQAAADCNGETVIVTFDPHPREVLLPKPNNNPAADNLVRKDCPAESAGIDHLVVVPFTREFRNFLPVNTWKTFL